MLILFFSITGLLLNSAQAYLPPSFFIVQTLAKKHSVPGNDDLKIRHRIFFYKGSEVKKTFIESLSFIKDHEAIIRISDESGKELFASKRHLAGTKQNEISRPFLYDLLFIKDQASIFERFKLVGLPMLTEAELYSEKEGNLPYKPETTVNLIRFEEKPIITLSENSGGRYLYWSEKDSLLPFRSLLPASADNSNSQTIEFRFSQFSVNKSFLYPKVTQVFKDGSLWARIELLDFKAPSPGAEKGEPDGDSREFIEQYLKWIR